MKEDQASSLRDLVEHIRLDSEDVRLSNKLFQVISEARKEIEKKYKLNPITDMTWDEKIDKLSSEAWMMEQVLAMLERFVERQTRRSAKGGKKTIKIPGRHGGKTKVYEKS